MIQEILGYFKYRGLKVPHVKAALFFLITEVAELTQAVIVTNGIALFTHKEQELVASLYRAASLAESVLEAEGGWKRNHQPKGTYDIEGELADVLMMNALVAHALEAKEPENCLVQKMAHYNYLPWEKEEAK
jgi:hypothetical protein